MPKRNTRAYKWVWLGRPTEYPIFDHGRFAFPKGWNGVSIAFGQSSRKLMENGKWTGRMQDAYKVKGVIYNA